MPRLGSWIEPFSEGIYVRPADAWIDPSQPKARALVTHGHADHARGGHGEVWATPETLAIMACRYGPQAGARPAAYGEAIRIGEVDVSFVSRHTLADRRPRGALREVRLKEATLRRSLGVAYRRTGYLSPASQRLMMLLRGRGEELFAAAGEE